jgi:hypothetical protein
VLAAIRVTAVPDREGNYGDSRRFPAAQRRFTRTGAETTPGGGSCDEAAVREAIVNSDAVDPSLSFEFTYLRCAEGFGWATISVEHGDAATVLFKGYGSDVEPLNLGSSVCTTDAGIPADVAAQLAPDPRYPRGDCP